MNYKKKLKIFVFGMQAAVIAACSGIAYYNERPETIPTMSEKEFAKKIKINGVVKDANFFIEKGKNKKDETYHYKIAAASVDDNSVYDLSAYPEVEYKEKIKLKEVSGKFAGYEVTLPYNLFWVGNNSTKDILLNDDELNTKSRVMIDTDVEIPLFGVKMKHPYNGNTKEELTESFYNDYKQKSSANKEIQKKRQWIITGLSGGASVLTCLIFYFALFRKMFKDNTNEKK